jgi:predicted TPR repeat methyltransferase
MTASPPNPNDHSWLTRLSTDSQETAAYYDAWAGNYDQTLAQWDYQSPTIVATLLKQAVPTDGHVLDAGCGTGLSGKALHAAGFRRITGIDISQASLDVAAQAKVYERLLQVNMQQVPLPLENGEFAAVQCVGVLTYVPDTAVILREFCRVVRPGGLVAFTQREDLFKERDVAAVMQTLADEGVWTPVSVSEPQAYLPGNADYADKVKVIYCVCRGT